MVGSKKASSRNKKYFVKTLTVLTKCVEKNIYVERWSLSSDDLEAGEGWCIQKCRLYGGPSDGVDIVAVDNGKLSFVIVPTRGMGIWKGKCEDVFLGWGSPVKDLVHPHYIDLEARGGLGWLDGFNEWIVRCGLANFGAPGTDVIRDNVGREKEVILPLHGKIANIPAGMVRVRIGLEPPFELGVEGFAYEQSMFGSNLKLTTAITTTPGSNSLKISDIVENLRGVPDEMQILYHCNYGSPFLEEGSRLIAPIRHLAPRDARAAEGVDVFDIFGAPQTNFVEQAYFMELIGDKAGGTKAMLMNKDGTRAVSVSFSLKDLPCFTLWKNTAAIEDGYVTGLEPGTGFPNTRRFERERNRVTRLGPKGKYSSEITLSVHLGKNEVESVINDVEKIRGVTKPTVFKEPHRDFSPV